MKLYLTDSEFDLQVEYKVRFKESDHSQSVYTCSTQSQMENFIYDSIDDIDNIITITKSITQTTEYSIHENILLP